MVATRAASAKSAASKTNGKRILRASTVQQRPKTPSIESTQTPDSQAREAEKQKRRRRRTLADPWNRRRKKATQTPRRPTPTHYTCRICCEELPLNAFIKRRSYSSVEVPYQCVPHLSRWPQKKREPACKPCIGRYISARLDTVGARNVSSGCLEPGCTIPWDQDYIMQYLPAHRLEDYNIGMLNSWKEKNPLFTCLNTECGAIGLLDASAPGYPEVVCGDCKTRYCALCKTQQHRGMSCGDYQLQKVLVHKTVTDQERETTEMMRKADARRCPECYIIIQKDGGCFHMYCSACHKSFNWDSAPNAIPGAPAPARVMEGVAAGTVCEVEALKLKR